MNHGTVSSVVAGLVGLVGLCASISHGGSPTHAYIIEGSGFFGAPGIELASVGYVNLSDPSDVVRMPVAGVHLRFGGADIGAGSSELLAFENTTNSLRVVDVEGVGGNVLVDSIGFMDSGVAGMAISNDGTIAYVTTTVGAFVRIVQADAATGAVLEVHNILTNPISSLAVVPAGHPTLTEGDLYGLMLTFGGGVRLVHIDLNSNSIVSELFVSGIGFTAQFETGLDFSPDGTLYGLVQGFDEVMPDVFVEISSHLFMIDPVSGAGVDLGVVESDQTWDAVTLVVDTMTTPCAADLSGDGILNFVDVSAFVALFTSQNMEADFNGDGVLNFVDVSAFVAAFTAGCP